MNNQILVYLLLQYINIHTEADLEVRQATA